MRTAALLLALAAMASAAGAAPPPGRYDARLCVAVRSDAAPSCGAAEAQLRAGGRLDVRVADIIYRLALRSSQLDVATLQGSTQIDAFSADYEWQGSALSFTDAAKGVRYEIRLGPASPTRR